MCAITRHATALAHRLLSFIWVYFSPSWLLLLFYKRRGTARSCGPVQEGWAEYSLLYQQSEFLFRVWKLMLKWNWGLSLKLTALCSKTSQLDSSWHDSSPDGPPTATQQILAMLMLRKHRGSIKISRARLLSDHAYSLYVLFPKIWMTTAVNLLSFIKHLLLQLL